MKRKLLNQYVHLTNVRPSRLRLRGGIIGLTNSLRHCHYELQPNLDLQFTRCQLFQTSNGQNLNIGSVLPHQMEEGGNEITSPVGGTSAQYPIEGHCRTELFYGAETVGK
jgi:hypothetical protein